MRQLRRMDSIKKGKNLFKSKLYNQNFQNFQQKAQQIHYQTQNCQTGPVPQFPIKPPQYANASIYPPPMTYAPVSQHPQPGFNENYRQGQVPFPPSNFQAFQNKMPTNIPKPNFQSRMSLPSSYIPVQQNEGKTPPGQLNEMPNSGSITPLVPQGNKGEIHLAEKDEGKRDQKDQPRKESKDSGSNNSEESKDQEDQKKEGNFEII